MQRNYYVIDNNELYHFNPNHDPRNGQFARGKGVRVSSKKKKLITREGDAIKVDKDRLKTATNTVVSGAKKAYKLYNDIDASINNKIAEDEKRRIVNSGDAKLVYQHRNELSKKDLDEAIQRINTELVLKELQKSNLRKTIDLGAEAAIRGATSGIELGTRRIVQDAVKGSVKFGKDAVADKKKKEEEANKAKEEAAKKADEDRRKKKGAGGGRLSLGFLAKNKKTK
jgi:hypothetical protein